MRKLAFSLLTLSLVLSAALQARAQTFINFDDLTFTNSDAVPVGYRSGAINTPDILVSYRSFDTTTDASSDLVMWNNDYGDLNKVAYANTNGLGAEITLTPTNGQEVNLASFDLAGYPGANQLADFIRVVDGSNNVLWSASSLTVAGIGPSHSSYLPNISSTTPIRLQWGANWNIGIDNVQFSQSITSSAPEPTSMVLLGLGGALMLRAARRRRSA